MTSKERKLIIEKISQAISGLKSDIKNLTEATKPVSPDNAIGRLSRLDAINNKSVAEAGLRKAKLKLDQLIRAQSRANETDFGICANCASTIPYQRILAVPFSTTCVNCA